MIDGKYWEELAVREKQRAEKSKAEKEKKQKQKTVQSDTSLSSTTPTTVADGSPSGSSDIKDSIIVAATPQSPALVAMPSSPASPTPSIGNTNSHKTTSNNEQSTTPSSSSNDVIGDILARSSSELDLEAQIAELRRRHAAKKKAK
jgi:hypothetical protein